MTLPTSLRLVAVVVLASFSTVACAVEGADDVQEGEGRLRTTDARSDARSVAQGVTLNDEARVDESVVRTCKGAPRGCTGRTLASCVVVAGCKAEVMPRADGSTDFACVGTAVACGSLASPEDCAGQLGCSWE